MVASIKVILVEWWGMKRSSRQNGRRKRETMNLDSIINSLIRVSLLRRKQKVEVVARGRHTVKKRF